MSTTDVLVFLVFISIMLFTSLNKKQTNLDIALDSQNQVSGIALFAMVFGTLFTATSLFGTARQVELFGFSYFIIACSDVVRTLILCIFIKNIFIYQKYLSVAHAIGSFCGPTSRIITGVCCLIFSIIVISIQFQWIYKTIDYLFNVNFNVGVLVAAFITICYWLERADFANITIVVKTLFLFALSAAVLHYLCQWNQKLTIFFIIIILHSFSSIYQDKNASIRAMLCFSFMIVLLPIIFSEIESLKAPFSNVVLNLSKQIESVKLDLFDMKNLPTYFTIFLSTVIPVFNPLVVQRMRLANSAKQARNVFVLASVTLFVFVHLISLCSVASAHMYPQVIANNDFNAFLHLVNQVVDTKIFKGIVFCGILSVMFSTIEPGIITANCAILHDISKNQLFASAPLKQQHIMLVTSTIFVCASALVLGLLSGNTTLLLMLAVNLWASIVTVPFVAAIFGARGGPNVFYCSAISGITINMLYYFTSYQPIKAIGVVATSIVINGSIFFIHQMATKNRT